MNFLKLDITNTPSPAMIIHGVNSQGIMRSGVAKALSDKWPEVKESYIKASANGAELGDIDNVRIADDLFVVNCWTQEFFGYDGKSYADANAIENCLEKVARLSQEIGIHNIYAPRIGCGLGGLIWETDVQPVFEQLERRYSNLNISICDL